MWSTEEAEEFWKSIVAGRNEEIGELKKENQKLREKLEMYEWVNSELCPRCGLHNMPESGDSKHCADCSK